MLSTLAQGLICIGVLWVSLTYLRKFFHRNPLDNLPAPPGGSFISGHFGKVFDADGWDYHKHISTRYGGVVQLRGAFGTKALFVNDPRALHHIMVKDQHIFEKSEGVSILSGLVFGKGLFAVLGDQHRKQRKMLNPVFSTAHMRDIIPIFYEVAHKLRGTLTQKVSGSPFEVDVAHWMSRTALELVAQSGLGYTFDPLTEHSEESRYSRGVRRFHYAFDGLAFASQNVLPLVHKMGTPRFRRWVVDMIPWAPLTEMRDISDIMHRTSGEVINSKRRAMNEGDEAVGGQVGGGKDIISALLKENMKASEVDRLTEEELFGQVSSIMLAAVDTTSNALSRTLYLLSHHQRVQETLREEIRNAHERCNGDRLTYDELVSLPYLDAICRETLRVYPPVHTLTKETREDVILPFSKPLLGNDGTDICEVVVPKGTLVFTSLLSSNCNPEVWGPDSYEWKPERWIEGLPKSVAEAKIPGIYSHLMTFIGGRRACIGFKFSQLEMKVVLCALLDKFKLAPAEGKEIKWEITGLSTAPTVVGESGPPQLPLLISDAN